MGTAWIPQAVSQQHITSSFSLKSKPIWDFVQLTVPLDQSEQERHWGLFQASQVLELALGNNMGYKVADGLKYSQICTALFRAYK